MRFITVFTTTWHWTLSWATHTQCPSSYPISPRSILILSSQLCLDFHSGLLPLVFMTKILCFHLSFMCATWPLISSSSLSSWNYRKNFDCTGMAGKQIFIQYSAYVQLLTLNDKLTHLIRKCTVNNDIWTHSFGKMHTDIIVNACYLYMIN